MDLKEFMEDSGMKQVVLAKRANVPETTLSRLKNGKEVTLSTAIRICKATHGKVTPEDLYNTLISKQNLKKGKDSHKKKDKTKKKKVAKDRVVS